MLSRKTLLTLWQPPSNARWSWTSKFISKHTIKLDPKVRAQRNLACRNRSPENAVRSKGHCLSASFAHNQLLRWLEGERELGLFGIGRGKFISAWGEWNHFYVAEWWSMQSSEIYGRTNPKIGQCICQRLCLRYSDAFRKTCTKMRRLQKKRSWSNGAELHNTKEGEKLLDDFVEDPVKIVVAKSVEKRL